jgi:hypothetical protein
MNSPFAPRSYVQPNLQHFRNIVAGTDEGKCKGIYGNHTDSNLQKQDQQPDTLTAGQLHNTFVIIGNIVNR